MQGPTFIRTAVCSVIRVTGKVFDRFGQLFELEPVIERCKHWMLFFFLLLFFFLFLRSVMCCPFVLFSFAVFFIVQPSLRTIPLRNVKPQSNAIFVAPSASLIGKVTVGQYSSIWYGSTLRADVSSIVIGKNTTIGDRTMIHCSSHPKELPTKIGDNVVVEPGCILHACTIEDNSYIGEGKKKCFIFPSYSSFLLLSRIGSQLLDGVKVEKNAVVAAGSLVPIGKTIRSGELWSGVPATFQRTLTLNEIDAILASANENAELAVFHGVENDKNWEEIEFDEYMNRERVNRSPHWMFPDRVPAADPSYKGPGSLADTCCKFSLFNLFPSYLILFYIFSLVIINFSLLPCLAVSVVEKF
jgi:carbonic anhydrase/acetyltransferase-like protein (isoleucine patch superfamily)